VNHRRPLLRLRRLRGARARRIAIGIPRAGRQCLSIVSAGAQPRRPELINEFIRPTRSSTAAPPADRSRISREGDRDQLPGRPGIGFTIPSTRRWR
jgi:hypothetical protein